VATAPAPLEGERDERTAFLLQSLRDLEREFAAGDLSDEDYQSLRDDYTARAAAALRAEERGTAPPAPVRRRRSPTQWALIVAGIVGFAVLAGVLVAQASGQRQRGEGISGEVTQTPTQAAGECISRTAEQQQGGDVATEDVLGCYQAVLDDDPDNAVARTYLGWTLYITARQAADSLPSDALVDLYVEARRQIERAVEADPAYADARAFLTVLAVAEGRYDEAAEQLAVFDDLDAPADMALLIDDVRQEIADNTGDAATTTTSSSTTVPG
jgi:tetratricopeptide (TPR) repeat protein